MNPDLHDQSVTAGRRLARLASTDLNLLVPLLALLEERGVTKAAARVGLSQPAMSHLLRRARVAFGDELLVRRGRAYELTARARGLIEPLRELLGELGDVYAARAFDPRTEQRTVTIAATSATSYVVMPPLLGRLSETAPGIIARVHTYVVGVHDEFFDDAGADVAILPDVLPSVFARERLYTDSWVAVADAANPRLGQGLRLTHLAELPHIVFSGSPVRTSAYAALVELGLRWTEHTRVSDFLLIPHFLLGSDAIAIVHGRVARSLSDGLAIRSFPLPFELPAFGMDLVWNPHLGRDPMKEWLRRELHAAAAARSFPS